MKFLLPLVSFFAAAQALAFPLAVPGENRFLIKPQWQAQANNTSFNFEGIVALDNCSGSIVQFDDSKLDDKALILTNGHCVERGFPAPGKAMVNLSSTREFDVLDASANTIGQLQATRLLYATMTGTDMALYVVNKTYGEIFLAYQVMPLTLARDYAAIGTDIEVISGFWKIGYSCSIENIVHELKEGAWSMMDSIRYSSNCTIKDGTSGSPVIIAGTRTVVGVNNTYNEDGASCTDENPCEIDDTGNVWLRQGTSYAQQISGVYSCVSANRQIDMNVPGCKLNH